MLTTTQAAKVLKISPQRVRVLIRAGRLKSKKFGPVHLIDPKALAAVKIRKPGRPWPKKKGK